MHWQQYISVNPKILFGKPVIKGTRIAVDLIVEKFASGETMEDILESYPHLSKEKILACLAYASEVLKCETHLPLVS